MNDPNLRGSGAFSGHTDPEDAAARPRFTIANGKLLDGGRPVEFIPAADYQKDAQGRPVRFAPGHPTTLCLHYTAGQLASDIATLTRDDTHYASVQLVLARDGRFVQLTDMDTIAWHAGDATKQTFDFGGRTFNWTAIGVEITNFGWLNKWDQYHAWRVEGAQTGRRVRTTPRIPLAECVGPTRHKKGGAPLHWHRYTPAQLAALDALAVALKAWRPSILRCVGHDEVAPRKVDPGPAFDIDAFRARHAFLGA